LLGPGAAPRLQRLRTSVQDFAAVVNSDKCHLEYLSLANCGLKTDILDILDAIGENERLLRLDVSGNQFGDKGAYALSKGNLP
jgi:hypothetical protein